MNKSLREEWRALVVTADSWTRHIDAARPVSPGEAGGFYARSVQSGLVAYLKPTRDDPDPHHRRAAYEKIASDLAFELDLNVPPVTLYDRPEAETGEATETSLSLLVANQFFEWRELCDLNLPDGGIANMRGLAQIVTFILRGGSELVAFDAWLGNLDRDNHRNALVVCEEYTLGSLYFLDFSNSMDFNGEWSRGNHLRFPRQAVPQALAISLTRERVRGGAEKILGLSEDVIHGIVSRIPDRFLAPERRATLLDGLIARKSRLPEEFNQWYPGL